MVNVKNYDNFSIIRNTSYLYIGNIHQHDVSHKEKIINLKVGKLPKTKLTNMDIKYIFIISVLMFALF